jgi:hypothetical protein
MLRLKCEKHPRSNGVNPKANCQVCIYLQTLRSQAFANGVKVVSK